MSQRTVLNTNNLVATLELKGAKRIRGGLEIFRPQRCYKVICPSRHPLVQTYFWCLVKTARGLVICTKETPSRTKLI